jgi:RimJ/RimL family protein N-acetyltransferase
MNQIFKTDRLIIRKLEESDLDLFHKMQSNRNVMRFVRANIMTFEENKKDLKKLILGYNQADNDFFIYAIERKSDGVFIGSVALVKDVNNDDEIGYRFLEKYWGMGYGTEIVKGLIDYCRNRGLFKIIANVAPKNVASYKIIKKARFKFVKDFVSDDLKIPEQKFELIL